MSRRIHELEGAPFGEACVVELDGKALGAKKGEPLMVTLLANGVETASRSVKYHRPRGAFCLSGSCGQCWMRIGGVPNRPACLTPAQPGCVIERENAFPSADFDIFRATDHLFASLDHHRLGTTPIPPLNRIVQDTARRMAGLGALSDQVPPPAPPMVSVSVDLAVIGSGPAGLAAARASARRGLSTLLIDARSQLGGQLRTPLFDDDEALVSLVSSARAALDREESEIWTLAQAAGFYHAQPGDPLELLVRRNLGMKDERLSRVRARVVILATGGYEETPLIESNDLPGHYGARALAELALVHGVLPGKRVVIIDGGAEAGARLAPRLRAKGVEVTRIALPEAPGGADAILASEVVALSGGTHVKGVELKARETGESIRVRADVVASALPVAAAFELARQAGCTLEHRPAGGGFVVVTDPRSGETNVPGVFAAGELTGTKTARAAAREGAIAGLSAALAITEDPRVRAERDALLDARGDAR